MKLLVLQNYDLNFSQIAALCCPSVAAYAAKHGYPYCCYRGLYSGLPSAWDKLFLAETLLRGHDYIWTVDSDILIYQVPGGMLTNLKFQLEQAGLATGAPGLLMR